MSEELLPCPFCGCAVRVVEREQRDSFVGWRKWFYIEGKHTGIGGVCPGEVRARGSKETAITAWNTRATPWTPIDDHPPHLPVLVSRPTDHHHYTPTTAFNDATGVWRVFRSEGGMEPLPFVPTHYMPLPATPTPHKED